MTTLDIASNVKLTHRTENTIVKNHATNGNLTTALNSVPVVCDRVGPDWLRERDSVSRVGRPRGGVAVDGVGRGYAVI